MCDNFIQVPSFQNSSFKSKNAVRPFSLKLLDLIKG